MCTVTGVEQGPLNDVVSGQYERWVYPEPIADLPSWLTNNWQWFDPSHSHRLLWPDRAHASDLDILIAGCGTNQAAVLAYTNPHAHVTAIDVSDASLAHHRWLKQKYQLDNLELHQMPIEDVDSLDRDFDLIVSTGVIHHLADPIAGLRALGRHLKPDGVIALMLYARYGRIGVEMMQSVFRDLGLHQDEAALDIVRSGVASLPSDHPLASYLSIAPDLGSDSGLVDTFLHGRDRSYTVDDCLDLVSSAGLVFQDWFLKSPYYPPVQTANSFYTAIAALPVAEQWSVMEQVSHRNACHFFLACRPDRPRAAYEIDFTSDSWLTLVPSLRYRCELSGSQLQRYDWQLSLDPIDLALVRRVDGLRTIREVIDETARDEPGTTIDLEGRARRLFQSLWQRDFLCMGTSTVGDLE